LQSCAHVNRMSTQEPVPGALLPVDPERHALEVRIERAKDRIVEDLNRASALVREVASRAGRGAGWMLLAAGSLIAAAVVLVIVRRRQRRIRVIWK
jgi:hypothetical protein